MSQDDSVRGRLIGELFRRTRCRHPVFRRHREPNVRPSQMHSLYLTDVVSDVSSDFLEATPLVRLPRRSGGVYIHTLHPGNCPWTRNSKRVWRTTPTRRIRGGPLWTIETASPVVVRGGVVRSRPEIGPYLFPSPVTGEGLSRRTIRKLCPRVNPCPAEVGEKDECPGTA